MNSQQQQFTSSSISNCLISTPSQTSILQNLEDNTFQQYQRNFQNTSCEQEQMLLYTEQSSSSSACYESCSVFSNRCSQASSESDRIVKIASLLANQNLQMDIESENMLNFEEQKSMTSTNQNQILAPQAHLISGDYLVDLQSIESSLLGFGKQQAGGQVDFYNSQLNKWKRCTFIEKASSENGCFYLSLEQKQDSQLTSIEEMNEIINSLKMNSNQMNLINNEDESQESQKPTQMIEDLLERASVKKVEIQNYYNSEEQSQEYSKILYSQYQGSVKKARNIMKNIVNSSGSTKSFVFAKLKAFNPTTLSSETTQLIYSPKLIQILFNNKCADSDFQNQILRKGLIEMFDSIGHLTLNSLEMSLENNNQNESYSDKKVSLVLYTSDNFQVPITVTLKKYNLIEESENIQFTNTCSQELLVFDIKIKIKYQKQLNLLRKNSSSSSTQMSLKKRICKHGKKQMKRKSFDQQKSHEKNECECKNCKSDQTEHQQEYFGYYLESLGFLNKFYPEKLSNENEKFDQTVKQNLQ